MDMKKKLSSSRTLYISHIEALQNVVRLHKASSNATLEDISSLASTSAKSIEEVCKKTIIVILILLSIILMRDRYIALYGCPFYIKVTV